jgi:hypothetical protein
MILRLLPGLALATAGLAAGCGDDDRPATWSYIHEAILAPSCSTPSCHASATAVAGVDLEDREAAYATLVGRGCDDESPAAPRGYVDPGHPESSRLLYLLRGDEVRVPMPPDRMLARRDTRLIEAWILDGAPCD